MFLSSVIIQLTWYLYIHSVFIFYLIFMFQKFIFMFKIAHEQMNRPGGVSEFAPLMNEGFELEKYTG
jgi:hypothetical protein